MKLGAEKKGELIALIVLLLVAAFMLWRTFAPAAAPEPAPLVPSPSVSMAAAPLSSARLDPTLHLEKLDRLRAINYTGSGRDLFHFGATPALAQAPTAAAALAAREAVQAARPMAPSGPPPPPPIPLKFYGFAQANGMPEKIFLQMGDDNYVVSQGDTIEHRYLIVNIGKVSVRVKDLQTQSEQELPLQQG